MMDVIPNFSIDMIDELDDLYPEKCANKKQTEREIWMYAGKRELVRNLKILKDSLEDEKYTKEVT
jgi:hypothetical protein